MSSPARDLVTGAFGNTGAAVATRLLGRGHEVATLTSQPARNTEVTAFGWDDLQHAFDGVDTFYNTFWMRTGNPGSAGTDYSLALERSERLIDAAASAGVNRVVHLSVAHADDPRAARYPYFVAKAKVEALLRDSGVEHRIIRPSLIFGGGPGMIEQLAGVLHRVPVMGIAGDGAYRVRPVHLDDVVELMLAAGATSTEWEHRWGRATTIDAVGPDRPTFDELVRAVATALGKRRLFVRLPTPMVIGAGRLLGRLAGEDLLTADELRSTMDGLADTDGPATGSVSVMDWIAAQGSELA